MKFNLNSTIKVRLNPVGLTALRDQHKGFNQQVISAGLRPLPYKEPRVDENGYIDIQVWDFIKKLGPCFDLGRDLPCEMEILIDVKDLKP